ncbi:hypothetical protein Tco_0440706, partial [Tanacetum coccineum]
MGQPGAKGLSRWVAGPQPRGSVGTAGDSGDVTGWLLGQPGTTPGCVGFGFDLIWFGLQQNGAFGLAAKQP